MIACILESIFVAFCLTAILDKGTNRPKPKNTEPESWGSE